MLKQSERQAATTVAGLQQLGVSITPGQTYRLLNSFRRDDAVYIKTDDEYLRIGTIHMLRFVDDADTFYQSIPWQTTVPYVVDGIDIAHLMDYCYTTGQ